MLETTPRDYRTCFTLRDVAVPLFRRKRVLLITFFVTFAAAAWLGLQRWHQYESHMAILVSREPLVTGDATNQTGASPASTSQEVRAEAELLKSRDLLEQVVLANGLQNAQGFFPRIFRRRQTRQDRVAQAVRTLASQIDVEARFMSNLIEVTYRSSDAALAYGVLNSLSNIYLEKRAIGHPGLPDSPGGCEGRFARSGASEEDTWRERGKHRTGDAVELGCEPVALH